MVCDARFKRSFQLKHHMAKSHGVEVNTIPTISICRSLPASSFNRNLDQTARQDGAKIRIIVDHCPSGSVLTEEISRPAQRAVQAMMGTSKPETLMTTKVSRPVQRVVQACPKSKPVQREVQMTMGISRPTVMEAAVGISRHVLETTDGVVSLLVYPVRTLAADTTHELVQEQTFPADQNIICQLENQILSATNESDLQSNILIGTKSNHEAGISDVTLDVNLAENNFISLENFSKSENAAGSASARSARAATNIDESKVISFRDDCLPKMTPSTGTEFQVIREATECLPLRDTLSPLSSEGKSNTMELLTLCHDLSADPNPGISTALTPDKGFADMTLPYDDVLQMLSASDSLDPLNCFESLHQDICR